ncbi:MAG: ribosome maturation factor RimP [Dissulfurimicrobium sp.]|uniref:ribosome maturation factor RimP n=1 Tax=Dissulfurimicrobium TaxID=1769732 RepID=UPI003C7904D1
MAREKKTEDVVRALLEPVIASYGMELVDVHCGRDPRGMVLRLVLDKAGGVDIDDCAEISRLAGDILDVHDPIEGPYTLEVSSPGINRPLKKMEDFERFRGQNVFIETSELINGRRRFRGLLEGVSNGIVAVFADKIAFEIPFEKISKARLDII